MLSSNRSTCREPETGSDPRITRALVVGAAATCVATAYVPGLSNLVLDRGTACPIQAWLGIRCPVCGMSHGVVALLRGDLLGSLRANAFAWVFLLLLVVGFLSTLDLPATRLRGWPAARHSLAMVGAAFVLYSIGRNLV